MQNSYKNEYIDIKAEDQINTELIKLSLEITKLKLYCANSNESSNHANFRKKRKAFAKLKLLRQYIYKK